MRRNRFWQYARYAAMLGVSSALDGLQLAIVTTLLFEGALCGVPSITGVGIVVTLVCGVLPLLGLGVTTFINLIFTALWTAVSILITGKKRFIAAGLLESVPVLNALPILTASSLYWIYTDIKVKK